MQQNFLDWGENRIWSKACGRCDLIIYCHLAMAWSVSSTFGIRNGWGLLYCPTPNEVTRRIPPFGFWTRNDSGINLFRFSQDTRCLKLITLFLQFCHLLVIALWDSAFSLRRQHCFWVVTIGHNHTTTNYDLIFHWSYSNIIFLHEGHAS